jgi:subtilisin family serine protease
MGNKIAVIAFGMHEYEIDEAVKLLEKPQRTEAFVIGEIDETKIADLEKAGLIVERVAAGGQPETPGLGSKIAPDAQLRSTAFSTHRVQIQDDLPDSSRPNVFLIQIVGPLLEERRNALKAAGAELLESYGAGSYTAYLRMEQIAPIRALDFVRDVMLYSGRMAAPGAGPGVVPSAKAATSAAGARIITYDVRVHRDEDVTTVRNWLQTNHIAIAGTSRRKLRIFVMENSSVLSALANLPEVERFEEYVSPRLWNDHAGILLKVNDPALGLVGFDGGQQIIGIADTGIDDTHADFAGRVVRTFARGRLGVHDDPHGHGTHVAGSAAGDGTASIGAFKGTAPAAKIVFQSLLDSAGGLGGLPLDLGDLLDEAYQVGVRIHNNSWGAATKATYTMNSSEVDDYVWKNPDMLVVIAAGNDGTAFDRQNTPTGVVDWLSMGSPATSKNAITVGASRSDRVSGGYSMATWGTAWPAKFPDPQIANERISGAAECMAAFSSRGPSDDRRIKPDLVAPGTDIVSARSAKAPSASFWGLHATAGYAYMGGTSMATPLVSGCAALVRQYYTQVQNHQKPSAALLRATLINGTRWLTGGDANASNSQPGNYDQGFGSVDMSTTIPCPINANDNFALVYVDSWVVPNLALPATGDKRRWTISVQAKCTLRICLAYTDYPGRGLQNNLNLLVQKPNNSKVVGNDGLRQAFKSLDVDNNVEVCRIENAAPGNYLVQITASNLLHSPQDFALVATGSFVGGLVPI